VAELLVNRDCSIVAPQIRKKPADGNKVGIAWR